MVLYRLEIAPAESDGEGEDHDEWFGSLPGEPEAPGGAAVGGHTAALQPLRLLRIPSDGKPVLRGPLPGLPLDLADAGALH